METDDRNSNMGEQEKTKQATQEQPEVTTSANAIAMTDLESALGDCRDAKSGELSLCLAGELVKRGYLLMPAAWPPVKIWPVAEPDAVAQATAAAPLGEPEKPDSKAGIESMGEPESAARTRGVRW